LNDKYKLIFEGGIASIVEDFQPELPENDKYLQMLSEN